MRLGLSFLLLLLLAGCVRRPPITAPPANLPGPELLQCPAGEEDMLRWFTPRDTSLHAEGNHNPLYTTVLGDRFYWTKSAKGWPWDIQLYDKRYIYLWITENGWNSPASFKEFEGKNEPLAPRCLALKGGKDAVITVPDTRYRTFSGCSDYTVKSLRKGVNEVWGPYPMNWKALGRSAPTVVVSYRYSCGDNYDSCRDKELYYLVKDYGLMQWQHYQLSAAPNDYKLVESSVFDRLRAGQTDPYFPCADKK
ncbi:MAG TPA: hypothetical protein VL177_15110 [Terriglobales bacterium]|nr:hypothetical protein [Terriglobales bacterium]